MAFKLPCYRKKSLVSMVVLLLLSALSLCLVTVTAAGTITSNHMEAMIIHWGHTGSHALCESIQRVSCVSAVCSEDFEKQNNGGNYAFQKFYDETHSKLKIANTTTISMVMVRALAKDAHTIQAGGINRRFIVLARKDLLLWSLSSYCKTYTCAWEVGDPQFQNVTITTKHVYNVEKLKEIAQGCVKLWEDQVSLIQALQKSGAPVSMAIYENFMSKGADNYATSVLMWVHDYKHYGKLRGNVKMGETCYGNKSLNDLQSPDLGFVNVHKVHSEDMRDWVENYEEVEELGKTLPTFSKVFSVIKNVVHI